VDGALGKITRFHSDIDILIYGNEKEGRVVLDKLLEEVNKQDSSFVNFEITDKDRQEFYHHFFIQRKGLGAEFYYIEVVGDPFANKKIVAKSDGSFTAEHKFETVKVTLNQVDFEAQSPIVELADRIYKRDIRGDEKRVCHEQDIANLKLITNDLEVEEKLKTLQKR
ncbi:MAG: hypothetical protein Q8P91_02885, partial [bacterium]|nr:hypothetical protein [bacterium]